MQVGIFEESYGLVAINSVAYGTQIISRLVQIQYLIVKTEYNNYINLFNINNS